MTVRVLGPTQTSARGGLLQLAHFSLRKVMQPTVLRGHETAGWTLHTAEVASRNQERRHQGGLCSPLPERFSDTADRPGAGPFEFASGKLASSCGARRLDYSQPGFDDGPAVLVVISIPISVDEPHTEGQLLVRALDPELVWLAHEHEPWRPRTICGISPALSGPPQAPPHDGPRLDSFWPPEARQILPKQAQREWVTQPRTTSPAPASV